MAVRASPLKPYELKRADGSGAAGSEAQVVVSQPAAAPSVPPRPDTAAPGALGPAAVGGLGYGGAGVYGGAYGGAAGPYSSMGS